MRTCFKDCSINVISSCPKYLTSVATAGPGLGVACGDTGEVLSPRRFIIGNFGVGNRIYDQDDNTLLGTNVSVTGQVAGHAIYVPSQKEFWCLTPGSPVYVEAFQAVAPFATTLSTAGAGGYFDWFGGGSIVYDSVANRVVVLFLDSGFTSFRLYAINAATKATVMNVPIMGCCDPSPKQFVHSASTNRFYVFVQNSGAGTVYINVYDAAGGFVSSIPISGYDSYYGLAVSDAHSKLYVATYNSGSGTGAVIAINLSDHSVAATLLAGTNFQQSPVLDVDDSKNWVVVYYDDGANKMAIINSSSNSVICNVDMPTVSYSHAIGDSRIYTTHSTAKNFFDIYL